MQRKILVTGANRGLGYQFTRSYLEQGDTVYAATRKPQAPALAELAAQYGDHLVLVPMEMTDTSSVERAAKLVAAHTDSLDIIINNAAIHAPTSFEPLEQADIDECLTVYDVNALGPLRVAKAFLPLYGHTGAKLVSISTESGSIGDCKRTKEFDYCMSKAALNMGCKLLQNYLAPTGVTVLAIQPGWMRTDMGGPTAKLDPYETAQKLIALFDRMQGTDGPIFVDNEGISLPW